LSSPIPVPLSDVPALLFEKLGRKYGLQEPLSVVVNVANPPPMLVWPLDEKKTRFPGAMGLRGESGGEQTLLVYGVIPVRTIKETHILTEKHPICSFRPTVTSQSELIAKFGDGIYLKRISTVFVAELFSEAVSLIHPVLPK